MFSINKKTKYFSVVEQQFDADVFKVNVILGNEVLLSCVLPSHLADLVSVTAWVDSEGNSFTSRHGLGNFSLQTALQCQYRVHCSDCRLQTAN